MGMTAASNTNQGPGSQAVETALRILKGAVAAKASDVHLRAGIAPLVRIDGELCPLEHPPLPESFVESTVQSMAHWAKVEPSRMEGMQLDFSVGVPDIGRFRVHMYRQGGSMAAVLRRVPHPIPDFPALRLPPVVKQISVQTHGLVLVTGATGNGKSTTIASMLQYMNEHAARHVVTLEDPIEYVFEDKMSSFSQREVGRDMDSFAQGLEGVLREDPDVLFIGEIRRVEEFDVALNAAESGRLVLSTFHSSDCVRAVQRAVQFYPSDQQDSVRARLADSLTGIIAQRLVPKRGSRSRVLATEVLTRAPTAQECIRDGNRLRGLTAALASSTSEYGSHAFDQVLTQMVKDKVITIETAKAHATSPADLIRNLKVQR